MINLTALLPEHIPAAAGLFNQSFKRLREAVPALPGRMEAPQPVADHLSGLLARSAGLAAWDHDRLVGFITWFIVNNFRDTGRKAAYVPEWGHAAVEPVDRVYRALYRAAGEQWQAAGCQIHAITLLAHDTAARDTWFWSGFGMGVVDAVRPMLPIETAAPSSAPTPGLTIRRAAPADAAVLAMLDAEHCQHYTTAPTFMTPRHVDRPDEIRAFLEAAPNTMWLALEGDQPAGYLRFSSASEGAAGIVASDEAIANVGAYIRPQYRGRRVAVALLNAAITYYRQQGFTCCAVDFESFNPEAADFWTRYFTPVCFSLFRVPENVYG